MSKLGLLGRAVVENRHGVDGPASKAVAENLEQARRVAARRDPGNYGGRVEIGGVVIAVDDSIPFMAVLIGAKADRVWVSTDTYDALVGKALIPMARDVRKWGAGMRYLVTEGGKYTEAAKAAMDSNKELIPAKDPLTMIEEDANRLVVQVASMEANPTESQLTLFAQRLADLRARFEAIEAQHERTGELINLAAVALTDSLE